MNYLVLGYKHIIPFGFDHILFILCLVFLNSKLKSIIWQATAFTLAHSITLALSMYGKINPPAGITEVLITFSILFVAIENIISEKLKPTRMLIIFIFGLIHGMGFSSALRSLGLPADEILPALLNFNIGVELGQVTIILISWFLICKWTHEKIWYRKRVVIPVSFAIAIIALYWTVERSYFMFS